jgi:hypothetical protein
MEFVATRKIILIPGAASVIVTTQFERVQNGAKLNRPASIWVVAQLSQPVAMYAPVPEVTKYSVSNANHGFFAFNYRSISSRIAYNSNLDLVVFRRTTGDSLLWVGTSVSLRMDSQESPRELCGRRWREHRDLYQQRQRLSLH